MKFLAIFFLFVSQVSFAALDVKVVLDSKGVIWGFDFMPDGKIIFTVRSGSVKIFDPADSSIVEVGSVPKVAAKGQGGMLDVLLDKNFSKNKKLYLAYSVPLKGGQTTRVSSYALKDNNLIYEKHLYTALPATSKSHHFGTRVVQDKKGNLFVTVGDRGERDLAQDMSAHRGKVIRIAKDKPEIWSYGHRNAQGAAFHPITGKLWTVEHGPRGGDELNIIEKGKNYGWPVITYGKEYWGPSIGEGTHKEGMEQPEYHYTPSIATSGMMIHSGKGNPSWKGNIFVGALKDRIISRLVLKDGKLTEVEKLFDGETERIRQLKEAKNGDIYYSTDSGKIISFKQLKGDG